MKELSVFVDESGDFGEYDPHSPFYIISMVFHDQSNSIDLPLSLLEHKMSDIDLPNHCIHAGPIIRGEHEYRYMDLGERRKIINHLLQFINKTNIRCTAVFVEKRHASDDVELVGQLSKKIASFIKDNLNYFLSYDCVKIYYDNGQTEVNKILSSVFNSLLENVEFRRVLPSDYRLFQVADLVCTLKLSKLKDNSVGLSRSEEYFFEGSKNLKKSYLKQIEKKSFY